MTIRIIRRLHWGWIETVGTPSRRAAWDAIHKSITGGTNGHAPSIFGKWQYYYENETGDVVSLIETNPYDILPSPAPRWAQKPPWEYAWIKCGGVAGIDVLACAWTRDEAEKEIFKWLASSLSESVVREYSETREDEDTAKQLAEFDRQMQERQEQKGGAVAK